MEMVLLSVFLPHVYMSQLHLFLFVMAKSMFSADNANKLWYYYESLVYVTFEIEHSTSKVSSLYLRYIGR